MDLNNTIVIYVILGICFVAISIILFAISRVVNSGSHRHRSIRTIKKQPRCLKIFRTRF